MNDALKLFVQSRLEALGINPFEAARRGALDRSYINDILIGRKVSIRDDKKAQVAIALEIPVSSLYSLQNSVEPIKVVGYAAAGSDMVIFADGQGPFDEVEAPAWATSTTVAVRIRGTSLGRHFDGWLAFYDDRRDPPDESILGSLCICGLAGGRVVIKKLRAGSSKGKFHLESETEPTLFDEVVEWAAQVREMRPK